jgi:quercetin dioxygenase-like cupin family protein
MAITEATFHSTATTAVAVACNDLPWHGIGRVGIRLRDMSFRDPARGLNLSVAVGVTGAGGFSPRHRHTFEQIRYYIDGPTKFDRTIYHPGDCVYFPEGVAYGPQTSHNDEDCLHVTLQFSGPSGIYFPTTEEQERARNEMAATGSFEGGTYRFSDGREQDANEAVFEHISGTKLVYPEKRYDAPVRMRVPAYRAEPLDGDARVTERKLATFNEIGPAIRFIEAAAGTTVAGATQPFTEVRVLVRGSARFEGRAYDGQSVFFFPAGAPFGALEIAADAQLLCVRFGANAA